MPKQPVTIPPEDSSMPASEPDPGDSLTDVANPVSDVSVAQPQQAQDVDMGTQQTARDESTFFDESTDDTESVVEHPVALVPTRNSLSTTPLSDVDVVETSVEHPPFEVGTMVGERYQVVSLISSVPGVNTYRVLDTQGYRRCWACGTGNSLPGDIYCAECGAELAGRHYRLQAFSTEPNTAGDTAPLIPVPEGILGNRIPGVSHVYDTLQPSEEGTVYVIWEEDYGQPLSSWLSGNIDTQPELNNPGLTTRADILGEEQVLTWMAQSAEVLAQLHAESIVGCPLTLDNLLVQPGDRMLLLDPTGCLTADAGDEKARQMAQSADLRNLATELERLYVSVRALNGQPGTGNRDQGSVLSTGPLPNAMNPAVVLTQAKEGTYQTAEDFARALRSLYEASKPKTDLLLWSGRASDVGRVRQINEDSVMTLEATALEHEGNLPVGLYVIADGMGGHQSGEVASSIAARTVGAVINSSLIGSMVSGDPVAHDPATCMALLRQAVLEANRRIADLARERHSDLGTTLVAALVIGNQLTVANVGDSRAYVWHDGNISPITKDHSLVAQLVEAGQITRDEIYSHPRRNEIYRALGDARITDDEVDVFSHRLQPGDSLLLCSDGLWDFVRDPEIAAIVGQEGMDPQHGAQALVDLANNNAGEDNISVVLVRVMGKKE